MERRVNERFGKADFGTTTTSQSEIRVFGQILAAQSIISSLPTTARIVEFYAQTLVTIPGVTACRVCLERSSAELGELGIAQCNQCPLQQTNDARTTMARASEVRLSCLVAQQKSVRSFPVDSTRRRFGFFTLKITDFDAFANYEPFVDNLSNYVAITLENRLQARLLQIANDELENRVTERTRELVEANQALSTSRSEALALMGKAVEARQLAEQVSTDLQHEVTERKRIEADLRELNERFILATTAANIGVWDWDIAENVLIWDDKMYALYGIRREDFSNAYEAWLNLVHPEDRVTRDEIALQARRGERAYVTDFRVIWPNGSVHYVEAHGQVVVDENGRPLRMIGVNFDITQQKRAEQEVRRLNEELEQRVAARTAQLQAANKELDAFAYTVSHDLRAPLRHIDGFLELLRRRIRTTLDGESQHYMDTISDSARRMGELIDDLLSFSRMGRQELSRRTVDLNVVVQEVVCDLEPDLRGRSVHWQVETLPTVVGDRALLRLVFVNLLSNALKFTRSRALTEIAVGSTLDTNSEIVVFVRDNGVGFDNAYSEKLFGVFQRLHRAEDYEGTGIGLANVRRIIERHGGRVWANGQVDQGAVFYFSLPNADAQKSFSTSQS